MGVTCSCFGKSQSDRGLAEGSDGAKRGFFQKVGKKFKIVFHKGKDENAPSNGGSRVVAAEPLGTNTTLAPRAISMQRVAPNNQPNPLVNSQNSSSSELQQNTTSTPGGGNTVISQRKNNAQNIKRSKPLAKESVEAKGKHSAASSEEEEFNDCVEIFSSADDEDVCPTCLEEYDEQNPKITSKCNHHFHLACIYEWMERSPSCPVCSKVMVFEAMT